MKGKILLMVLVINLVFLGIYVDLKPNLSAADSHEQDTGEVHPVQNPKDRLEIIQARESEIQLREMELKELEQRVEEKIKVLQDLEASVKAEVESYRRISDERIKHLVKIYSSMKPQAAAGLMNNLDLDVAVEVFLNMKGEIAGGILSYMDTKKAATITSELISYRNTHGSPME